MARAGDGKQRSNRRKRQHLLQKRVDNDELNDFISRARKAGFQNHRDFLGALISGEAGFDRRERHDLLRIKGELGKQGSNLNRLIYAVNAGRITSLSADDMRIIHATLAVVEQASAEIRAQLA